MEGKIIYMNGDLVAKECRSLRDVEEFENTLADYLRDFPGFLGNKEFAVNLAKRSALGYLLKEHRGLRKDYKAHIAHRKYVSEEGRFLFESGLQNIRDKFGKNCSDLLDFLRNREECIGVFSCKKLNAMGNAIRKNRIREIRSQLSDDLVYSLFEDLDSCYEDDGYFDEED